MRAFIIRPFGLKEGNNKEQLDFDKIEIALINPALERLNISGRTTIEIMRSGNIREDMFNRLLTADLVIADISLHNPNVYYELGIRHAFRDKYTFLIRSNVSPVPFDLMTDRYLVYDHAHPENTVEALTTALQQTLNTEKSDSPVFQYLPHLKPEDSALFLAVPREFSEAVERAKHRKLRGDLRLLATEAEGFVWEVEGMRAVGRAQFELNSLKGGKRTWEAIQRHYPSDLEANLKLSTIYQRLGDYPESEQALNRIFKLNGLSRERLSEVHALHGRNLKTEWEKRWTKFTGPEERRKQALRSPLLERAYKAYLKAFNCDLNNYDAGFNALFLLIIEAKLATELTEVWGKLHEHDEDEEGSAKRELKKRQKQIDQLKATVKLALDAERQRLDHENLSNFWFESAEAGFSFLTSNSSEKITQAYADALAISPPYADEAMCEALNIYKELGLLSTSVAAALEAFKTNISIESSNTRNLAEQSKRILLFAGHQIDSASVSQLDGKPASVRFPASVVEQAKNKIKEKIAKERDFGGIMYSMAGGANGGDLLFHEACHELKIKTKLYLPTTVERFVGQFVSPAGGDWIERFRKLYERVQREAGLHILDELDTPDQLPRWLQEKPNYSVRRRNNLWLLNHALALSGEITLLVLWDGQRGTGPGDIGDLVNLANDNGVKISPLFTEEILAAPSPEVAQ
jgi:hypothetical protein